MEKKRHTGRTILLIILAVVILLPVLAFCYLCFCGWDAKAMQTGGDPEAPYAGTAVFHDDGTVDVPMENADVRWLMQRYDVEGALEEAGLDKLVQAYALALEQDGVTLYVDGKLLGFLPVPLKVSMDAAYKRGEIELTIREVRLGRWISIPLEKLASFNVPETFAFDLDEVIENSKLTNVTFEQGRAVASEQFLKEFLPKLMASVKHSGTALSIYIYEGDAALTAEPLLKAVLGDDPASNGAGVEESAAMQAVADAPDTAEVLTRLLALCTKKQAEALVADCDDFERHFIIDDPLARSEALRTTYLARVAAGQTAYEGLLSALREKYKRLELTYDVNALLDNGTGEPIVLSSLSPTAKVDDAEACILLLRSSDAFNAVKTFDMPVMRDVPHKSKAVLKGEYEALPCDLGVVLRMPCGIPACLYYQGNEQFVINCIDEALMKEFLGAKKLTMRFSDWMPRPPTRQTNDPPAPGLTPCTILYIPQAEQETQAAE